MGEKRNHTHEVENTLSSLKHQLARELKERLKQCTTSAQHDSSELLDLANDSEMDEMSTRIVEADSLKIGQIEEALRMLREGNYGECQHCGKQISKRRLKAIPFATMCIRCKEREERAQYGAGAASGGSKRTANANIDLTERKQSETSLKDVMDHVEKSDVL